jgi:DnaJ-domain-containing protein 1
VGILGGPFGVAFGFLIGFLVDQMLKTARFRNRLERHFSEPGTAKVSPEPLVSLIGIGIAIARAGGPITSRQVIMLKDYLGKRFKLTKRGYERVGRIIDQAVGLDITSFDLAGLAKVVKGSEDEGEPLDTLRFLAELAGARQRGTSAEQGLLLEQVGVALGLPEKLVSERVRSRRVLDRDSCAILGVSRYADLEEVRRAYRALAAQFHPDSNTDLHEHERVQATEAFLKIRSAYERLIAQIGPES